MFQLEIFIKQLVLQLWMLMNALQEKFIGLPVLQELAFIPWIIKFVIPLTINGRLEGILNEIVIFQLTPTSVF